MPIASDAITTLMRVAEPLVVSTNQGSAIQVICAPVVDTTSAARSARTGPVRRTLDVHLDGLCRRLAQARDG